ncbi:MAG: HDOD domain-containing protein [Candidatus Didemnitutus sp.]|nr:HDOD domain-containing protein [Candidatus Didemnitutus sp.]
MTARFAALNSLKTTPDEIVRQLHSLPSAPRVLPKLKRLLSDGNSTISEVVNLVRLDPGMAARVLQVGNSAYYSQGLRCYTVEEAVGRVGYDQIYELVAHAVASQVLVRPLLAYGMEPDELWENSIACAVAAEHLADRFNIDRDIAYTVGLFYGVGLTAIDDWVGRTKTKFKFVSKGCPLETCEDERTKLGFHNAEVGAALLRHWEFPVVISEPVRWQYLPRATAAHTQLATLLHTAKWVRTCVRPPHGNVPLPFDPSILRGVALSTARLKEIVSEVAAHLKDVGHLLEEIRVEEHKHAAAIGERAVAAART